MSVPSTINFSSLRKRTSVSGSTRDNSREHNNDTSKSDAKGFKKQKKKLNRNMNDALKFSIFCEETNSTNMTVEEESKHEPPSPTESVFENMPTTTAASGDASASIHFRDDFYNVPCEHLARTLLGKILVRRLDSGHVLKGRIVETECYLGVDDQASHSFRGKMTERNAPMFMKPGTSYVYFTYGMYYCFNISSQGPGAAVLIRALEPLEGLDVMAELRATGAKNKKKKTQDAVGRKKPHELCNGPSKLCIAMAIDRDSCNKRDLSSWPGLSVYAGQDQGQDGGEQRVVVTKRVGIESAGREWADKPLRFYILGNPAVSKRDKAKEKETQ